MRTIILCALTFLAITSAWAQDASKVTRKNDVIYGLHDGSGLLADVAYPDGRDRLPAIVMVHGGRWRTGSKNDAQYNQTEIWAHWGFFAMNLEYRLIGSSPAPACYQDLYTAIRWVHAHAADYHIDPNRIYIMGNSSGGHEATLAATLGQGPYPRTGGWEKADAEIRAVISVSGAYDLNTLSWGNLWTPIAGDPNIGFTTLSGATLEEARRLASPIKNIGPNTKPMLLLHSDDDRSVPIQQAIDMDKALSAAKIPHKFIHYTDKGHIGFTDFADNEARAFIADLETKAAPQSR
jgi:acetyl esterase